MSRTATRDTISDGGHASARYEDDIHAWAADVRYAAPDASESKP